MNKFDFSRNGESEQSFDGLINRQIDESNRTAQKEKLKKEKKMGLEFFGKIEGVTKNGAELPKFEVFKFASSRHKSRHMYWDSTQADVDTVKIIFEEVAKSKVLTFVKEADNVIDPVLKQAKDSKDKTGNIVRIFLKFRNNNGGVNTIKKTLEFWNPDVIWRGNEKDSKIGNFSLSAWTIEIPDDDKNADVSVLDQ